MSVSIGAAFGKITTSLVNDVLMPPLGLVLGKVDFTELFVALNGASYATLAAAFLARQSEMKLPRAVPESFLALASASH